MVVVTAGGELVRFDLDRQWTANGVFPAKECGRERAGSGSGGSGLAGGAVKVLRPMAIR